MMDAKYQLIEAEDLSRQRSKRKFPRKVALVGAITAALILAILYAPLVWESASVSAIPVEVSSNGAPSSAAQLAGQFAMREDHEVLADLYAQVSPSVVNIQVSSQSTVLFPQFDSPDGPPLQQSQGSGFIYDDAGHIVTNNHVVEDAESILVVFSNGYWADAEVVAADPQADLAVIEVTPPEGMDWRPLELENSDVLRVGHKVIAIGNPFGLDGTMTTGIVSALGRGIPVGDATETRYTLPDVIQTDAAINPGNSGGPLLDLNGKVVGLNFAIRSEVRSNSGVGFAIPVSIMRRVIPALIEKGAYSYAYLGLSGSSIGPMLAGRLELPSNLLGVYVAEVIPGGPSDAAGLHGGSELVTDEQGLEYRRGGDIVVAIDDVPVIRFEDLVSYLVTKAAPEQSVVLTVLREGETLEIEVTLAQRPASVVRSSSAGDTDEVNAREAIAIATEAVEESGLLIDAIDEKVATPDEVDGEEVWIVELSAGEQMATVTIDRATGDVLELDVK